MSAVATMGFMGRFDLSIDAKGRLFLPAVFRGAFADGGVLAARKDKVVLYTPDSYQIVLHKVRALRDAGQLDRDLFDAVFANSSPVQADAQGRIGIPRPMREEYRLEGPVTMLGTDECLSIYRIEDAPITKPAVKVAAYETLNALGL